MRFTWDEKKRNSNVRKHEFDFIDAPQVFDGVTYTFEDDGFPYGEPRFVTIGWLELTLVTVIHTETEDEIRIISFRKASRPEQEIYFASLTD
jgi:uncharacterized protein